MSQNNMLLGQQVFEGFFSEGKKSEDFLLIMYKFPQFFTVFDLSEVKQERILPNRIGDLWRHFLRI